MKKALDRIWCAVSKIREVRPKFWRWKELTPEQSKHCGVVQGEKVRRNMRKYRHHSYFPKEKHKQGYLVPHVCFVCRKSFKKPQQEEQRICPECGSPLTALNRKFSAPKASNTEQWKKVQLLVEHGFRFQSIYARRDDGGYEKIAYPTTLNEAKDFIRKYQEQAVKVSANTSV